MGGRHRILYVVPAFLAGGCSWIYDPSNIHALADATPDTKMVDAFLQTDARVDTPIPMDADPTMLAIDSVTPGSINEGAGQMGARAALIVIHGKHMTANATVQVTGSASVSVLGHQVSADGNWMAVTLAATVDMTNDTGTQPLTISVDETGAPSPVMLTGLVLNNLPQFPTGTTIDASTLAPLYSQVSANNVTFTGDSMHPVIIKSVSSITMGTVNVNGASGKNSNGGVGGPGGCGGGAAGAGGGCTGGFVGGGGGASGSGGGGGGGNALDGTAGNGTGAGAAGPKHGNDQVVNLVISNDPTNTNQASGGGGGGSMVLASAGLGGGGGGTIQLDAGGNISVSSINANGGDGTDAGGVATAAGGGGGGAGGIVIVRSAHGTVSVGASALPGMAGGGAVGGGGGGAGALGRVRIDMPASGNLPTTTPAARRGPMFATATPVIVTDVNPMMTVLGTSMDTVDGYDLDAMNNPHEGEPKNQTFTNGSLSLTPAMLAGYNKLCLTLEPGARGGDLADTCIEIAYLP